MVRVLRLNSSKLGQHFCKLWILNFIPQYSDASFAECIERCDILLELCCYSVSFPTNMVLSLKVKLSGLQMNEVPSKKSLFFKGYKLLCRKSQVKTLLQARERAMVSLPYSGERVRPLSIKISLLFCGLCTSCMRQSTPCNKVNKVRLYFQLRSRNVYFRVSCNQSQFVQIFTSVRFRLFRMC